MSDLGYLLDTNVISETRRLRPNAGFSTKLHELEQFKLFISVMTLGELRKGVAHKKRSDPVAASSLERWVDGMESLFSGRILPVDLPTARLWGELSGDRPRAAIDTILAATAIVHGLTLVTRNTADVADLPVNLLNPWLL